MGIVVAALGSQLELDNDKKQVHRRIGIAVIAAFAVQAVLAVLWRPKPAHKNRYVLSMNLLACKSKCETLCTGHS